MSAFLNAIAARAGRILGLLPGGRACAWGWMMALLVQGECHAQVAVTARFDTNRITSGQSTFLRVFAQVPLADRANAERIFSWYVDVVNTNGAVASGNYVQLNKATSDKDPFTSFNGTVQGPNLRGIFDTFLNTPGAGVLQPIELFSIPVTGNQAGRTRFLVQSGSGWPLLEYDFLVVPLGGGLDPLYPSGANYALAFADLEVQQGSLPPCSLNLTITPLLLNGQPGGTLRLNFSPCPGYNHIVEESANLAPGGWTALPGAPHNTGVVTVINNRPNRNFRVRAVAP